MTTMRNGSVDYVICEMQRIMLKDQVFAEVKEMWGVKKTQVDSSRCPKCKVLYFYELDTSSNTCKQCGHRIFVLEHEHISWHARKRYNRNAKHIYAKKEHFFQTLLDVTCTGKRHVPSHIVHYCKAVLGRGMHITFQDVFDTLQSAEYKDYYNIKYEISARLRGVPEIVLTARETERIRGQYHRYDECFYDFQVEKNIGKRSRSGRLRLFWPVRFIMVEMLKLIGRDDLIESVKPIAGPGRNKKYRRYWYQLEQFVAKRRPIVHAREHPMVLTRIPCHKARLTYSEYLAQQRGQPPPLVAKRHRFR